MHCIPLLFAGICFTFALLSAGAVVNHSIHAYQYFMHGNPSWMMYCASIAVFSGTMAQDFLSRSLEVIQIVRRQRADRRA